MDQGNIILAGATGNLGGRIAQVLLARGVKVTILSKHPQL